MQLFRQMILVHTGTPQLYHVASYQVVLLTVLKTELCLKCVR